MVLFHLRLRMLRSALGRHQVVDVLDHLDFSNCIREMLFQRVVVEEWARNVEYRPNQFYKHMFPNFCWVC